MRITKILETQINLLEKLFKDSKFFDFLNCLFIGKNIRVVLKFLESSIGGNFYSFGVYLLIAGCSLAVSIIFTILLIITLKEIAKSK